MIQLFNDLAKSGNLWPILPLYVVKAELWPTKKPVPIAESRFHRRR